MNRRTIETAVVAAVLAFAISNAQAAREPEIKDRMEKSFQAKQGGLLTFKSNVASAHIDSGNSDTVRVEIERTVAASSRDEADELLKKLSLTMVEQNGDVTIVALMPDEENEDDRRRVHLHARITVPRKFNLNVRAVGSSTVGDLDGTAHLATAGGSLKVGNISGPLTAKSGGGSILVGNVGGNLEARSGGGSIKAGRIAGRVIANAGGGSVSIEEATDAIDVKAEGGSVSAYISEQPRTDCKITANAGNVDLRLPDSAAISLDAACTAGRIRSDFAVAFNGDSASTRLTGDIRGGGPSLVLRASAGNITLRKGAP